MKRQPSNKHWLLLPVWGIFFYVLLYVMATRFYPGGSDRDKTSPGFSWLHNYWCELMAPVAQNGQPNTARPVAITAMYVLAMSLIIFWYIIPRLFTRSKYGNQLIRYSGIGSMVVLTFLLAGDHDTVMNIAGLLGCIAITTVLVKLFTHSMYGLFYHGLFCLLLCGINNYVYYTGHFMYYLPVIQKISFIVFLGWFILLSLKLNHVSTGKEIPMPST